VWGMPCAAAAAAAAGVACVVLVSDNLRSDLETRRGGKRSSSTPLGLTWPHDDQAGRLQRTLSLRDPRSTTRLVLPSDWAASSAHTCGARHGRRHPVRA